MNTERARRWFDWRDLLHLPGIVPPDMPAVRIAAIVGGLGGAVTAAYFEGGVLAMLAASFAGGYVSQVLGFSLRRTLGDDFISTMLRGFVRVVFGGIGIFSIGYAAYGGLRIASNGRLWAIGGVGFFGSAGIGMLIMAVAPNLLFGYRRSIFGIILGCVCLLLTLTSVASAIMHPSWVWLLSFVSSIIFTALFLLKPPRFPMSPAEGLWGKNGMFGMWLGADGGRPADTLPPSAEHSDEP